MFETTVVRARAMDSRSRVSLLTLSLIAHSSVIIGVVGASVATIDFPNDAPRQFAHAPTAITVHVPPPLGRPDGGAKPEAVRPEPAARSVTPPDPGVQTAPGEVPERIVPLEAAVAASSAASGSGSGTVAEPLGVPWGEPDSLGELDAPPLTTQPVEEKVYHPGGEVSAPLLTQRVEPVYPPAMLKIRMRGTVVVRCVIDKQGRVRNPRIVSTTHAAFNDSVLDALQQWRYRPGSYRGQTVETFLDVTVNFSYR